MTMKLKRLAATVSASFEDILTKMENHEAVADCAIDDMRTAVAQIRVQQRCAADDLQRLQKQRDEASQAADDWQTRALKFADTDEPKALQCLQRSERQQQRADAIAAQVEQHHNLVDELLQTLQTAEGQLQTLMLKRTALSARGARSRSMKKMEQAGQSSSVNAVFDRWETVILADEALDHVAESVADPLEREIVAEEQQSRLQGKLAELKAKQRPNPPPAS